MSFYNLLYDLTYNTFCVLHIMNTNLENLDYLLRIIDRGGFIIFIWIGFWNRLLGRISFFCRNLWGKMHDIECPCFIVISIFSRIMIFLLFLCRFYQLREGLVMLKSNLEDLKRRLLVFLSFIRLFMIFDRLLRLFDFLLLFGLFSRQVYP